MSPSHRSAARGPLGAAAALGAIGAVALLCVPPAAAQAPDAQQTALARSLFEEGVGLADRAQWADAIDRFRRALALRDAPAIRFNLGRSLGRVGRLVEATEMLRSVESHPDGDAAVRAQAQRAREELAGRFAHLLVRVSGATRGVHARLDGQTLPDAALGVPMPVDPGMHELVALRGEAIVGRSRVQLSDGARRTIELVIAPSADEAAHADEAAQGMEASGGDEEPRGDGAGDEGSAGVVWIVVGAVALAAAGVVVAILVASAGGADPTQGDFEPGELVFR